MIDYQEIQERGHVSTLEYLKRAHSALKARAEMFGLDPDEVQDAIHYVCGNDYTKVMATVREHGGIQKAIAALEANNETE